MITPDTLAILAGILVSSFLEWTPKIKDRFNLLTPSQKQMVMWGAMIIAALGIYGISCTGIIEAITCDKTGFLSLLRILGTAIGANFLFHGSTKSIGKPTTFADERAMAEAAVKVEGGQ